MNEKALSIQRLVAEVERAVDSRDVQVVDHWEGDLCAIGFMRRGDPSRVLYVNSFGQREGEYSVIRETSDGDEQRNSDPLEALSAQEVIEQIIEFLRASETRSRRNDDPVG